MVLIQNAVNLEGTMKWLKIGSYSLDKNEQSIILHLHEGYEPALHKLDLFSHCQLYLLKKDRLDLVTGKLSEFNEKLGQLTVLIGQKAGLLGDLKQEISGQLVDIKPYFPIEEVIQEADEPSERFCINYTGEIIGSFEMLGKRPVIQLTKDCLKQFGKEFKGIKNGDHLRLLWYFHRFDKDAMRKNRTCNPPYNNAPKTGIFASRSPLRPNPLGGTTVEVQNVDHENGIIEILGFDGFQGTPIFQIMRYEPSQDLIEGATLPSWVSHWTDHKTFEPVQEITIESSRTDQDSVAHKDAYFSELDTQPLLDDEYTSD
jgi:excinuclease ABC subunit A